MFARTTTLLLGLAAAANALVANTTVADPRSCGSHLTTAQVAKMEAHFAANKIEPSATVALATATINVYYHVC
jgi:hypothetical protein